MSIYFVGGLLDLDGSDFIKKNSIGVVQNAANVFQLNLLKGFDQVFSEVKVVNLPFIGSYPVRFKKILIKSGGCILLGNTQVITVGFCNLAVVKYFSRFYSLIMHILRNGPSDRSNVFIYSIHFPFIAATLLAKLLLNSDYKVFVIVPDLPEFMSDNEGLLYRFLKYFEGCAIKFALKYVTGFVLLTKYMADKLDLNDKNYIVVEGVASEIGSLSYDGEIDSDKKVVFYSGTLAPRYGVKDLIDAFLKVENFDAELWICGEGDSRSYIEKASIIDSRIKFYGQISRIDVLKFQMQATVLVNPRTSSGEYTKYSFPSKIIEYMSTGVSVIMHSLPGIPPEYFNFCFLPQNESVDSLRECIQRVLSLESSQLKEMGLNARDFVTKQKSSFAQALKIKKFIEEY